jgi:hypothetical protein
LGRFHDYDNLYFLASGNVDVQTRQRPRERHIRILLVEMVQLLLLDELLLEHPDFDSFLGFHPSDWGVRGSYTWESQYGSQVRAGPHYSMPFFDD